MKTFLLAAILSVYLLPVSAQNMHLTTEPIGDTSIYVAVAQPPEYPRRNKRIFEICRKIYRYPPEARSRNQQGKVIAQFVVEKNGAISNIEIIRSVSPALDKEAIRVLSNSQKWLARQQNGSLVRVRYVVPIVFNISNKIIFSNR